MENIMRNLIDLLPLLKYPSLTEKSINLYKDRQYTFVIDRSVTKEEMKLLIENLFSVQVLRVNTCLLPWKTRRVGKFIGRRPRYKKAYVKLKQGQTIADLVN
jgi:large subunit ribosomal protein L23